MKTHKYKQGIKTKLIHPTIPIDKEVEILDAIQSIVKDDLNVNERLTITYPKNKDKAVRDALSKVLR